MDYVAGMDAPLDYDVIMGLLRGGHDLCDEYKLAGLSGRDAMFDQLG